MARQEMVPANEEFTTIGKTNVYVMCTYKVVSERKPKPCLCIAKINLGWKLHDS